MIPEWKIYPRSQGHSTVYLQNVVTDPAIQVGAYTIYDDFVNNPGISSGTTCCTTIPSATMTG